MKFEPDIDLFQEALKQLAELQGKSQREVVLDQAALFARDGMQLTPPFGNTPLTEGPKAQQAAGKRAITNQVKRAFKPLDWFDKWKNDKVVSAMLRMATKKRFNPLAIEHAIRSMGFKKISGVIEAPTDEAHNASRGSDGRVRKRRAQWFVRRKSDIERFIKAKLKLEGKAKAGWLVAIDALNSIREQKTKVKIPPWVARNRDPRGLFEVIDKDPEFGVVAANTIPYAQKHSPMIEREAWKSRYISAQKQAYMIYQGMMRKARALKLQ